MVQLMCGQAVSAKLMDKYRKVTSELKCKALDRKTFEKFFKKHMKSTPQIKAGNTGSKMFDNWRTTLGLFTAWALSLVSVFLLIDHNLGQIILYMILFFIFSAWGHLLVYPLCYKKGRLLEGFIWGTILGIASGALITSIIVYLTRWNLITIFLIVAALPATTFLFLVKKNKVTGETRAVRFNDVDILLIALLIVTLFFYFPFKNLGALIDDKYLYSWLFGHDFINRMVHVVSLSRGLPLDSFFFSGETLSYYWLAYVYPALLININFIKLDSQQLLQLTVLSYSLLCAASLVIFFKHITTKRKYVLMLMFLALCCYSYSYL